jgi:D-alanyl-D-alanine carboxypeptidase (penicillin-binding protein 5/6)
MYLIAYLWLILTFLCNASLDSKELELEVGSEYVILINGKSGKVLFQKNAEQPCFPASTTKIATVLYALIKKPAALTTSITASKEAMACVSPQEKQKNNYGKYPAYWLESDGTSAGIKVGEILTFQDLLYGNMLASGNDASNVLAEFVGNGSIPAFMTELNRFFQIIGCRATHFCNPHGLPHPEHVTCAKDMARLAQCALCHPLFCEIVKSVRYEQPATNKQPKRWYIQTNRLLKKGPFYYPYAIGVKTGYTSKASKNLVVAAEKEDRLLIAAIMKNSMRPGIYQDAHKLFETAFQEQKQEKLLLAVGEVPFSRTYTHGKNPVFTYITEPLQLSFYPSEEPEIAPLLVWDSCALPIKQGQRVGEIRLLLDGVPSQAVPLLAKNEVQEDLFSYLWGNVESGMQALSQPWLICCAALLGVGALFWICQKQR